MVERGVRFVQLISTDWDGHAECETNHRTNGAKVDKPIAALLSDLKQRGLLESTLVVSVGEFGRTPMVQGVRGRDHHPYGFSAWMAGGKTRSAPRAAPVIKHTIKKNVSDRGGNAGTIMNAATARIIAQHQVRCLPKYRPSESTNGPGLQAWGASIWINFL